MAQQTNDAFLGNLQGADLAEENLLNLLPSPTYICDTTGVIHNCNKLCTELWGRQPDQNDRWCCSGQTFTADNEPLDMDQFPAAVAVHEKRAVTGADLVIKKPDGNIRLVVASANPIFDKNGAVIGVINVLVDVTDVRAKEQTTSDLADNLERLVNEKTADLRKKHDDLKKSEERYHKMIDEVQDYAILLLDKDGTILNWNQGAQRIKGYKEEEIVGKNFSVFYRDSDRADKLPQQLIELARTEGRAIHEGPRLRKDKTLFWGSITITALHDDEGNVIGFSKVTRDLTEKKLAEDRIRQYTEELEYQNRELEQFAYAAAHDMKEPLRKVLFYINHIKDAAMELLPEKSQNYLQRSLDAAARMQRLIDDLLAYSRATAKHEAVETVELRDIFNEAIASHQETIKDTDAELEIGDLPAVRAVPFQVRQCFDNLVGNALKYRDPSRSPKIIVNSKIIKGDQVDVDVNPNRDFLQVSVRDNGIGFDAAYSEQMFDLFNRLHADANLKGTGIGLALCKRIMQNHMGYIKADGIVGKGAEFRLYFPLD